MIQLEQSVPVDGMIDQLREGHARKDRRRRSRTPYPGTGPVRLVRGANDQDVRFAVLEGAKDLLRAYVVGR